MRFAASVEEADASPALDAKTQKKREQSLLRAAREVQTSYTTTYQNATFVKELMQTNPKWKHLKSEQNMGDLADAIKELDDAVKTNIEKGEDWEEWLTRDLGHLKKETETKHFLKMLEKMPEFVGPSIKKLNDLVKGLKAQHAQKMQSAMAKNNMKRNRKDKN